MLSVVKSPICLCGTMEAFNRSKPEIMEIIEKETKGKSYHSKKRTIPQAR